MTAWRLFVFAAPLLFGCTTLRTGVHPGWLGKPHRDSVYYIEEVRGPYLRLYSEARRWDLLKNPLGPTPGREHWMKPESFEGWTLVKIPWPHDPDIDLEMEGKDGR